MAEKGKQVPARKDFKSPYKDPTGGLIFSREDWNNVFLPNLLSIIDRNVQELKLKLKFDKEPPQKQGMFNRLSNWWSNIFWGKHNKYHNPYYHRNILGALGSPSKKNEMTLGIYKILKESSEKYELLLEKRLVMDDIIDDWLADLNLKISSYFQSVQDRHYVPNYVIKAAYNFSGKEEEKSPKTEIRPSSKSLGDAGIAGGKETPSGSRVEDTPINTDVAKAEDTPINTDVAKAEVLPNASQSASIDPKSAVENKPKKIKKVKKKGELTSGKGDSVVDTSLQNVAPSLSGDTGIIKPSQEPVRDFEAPPEGAVAVPFDDEDYLRSLDKDELRRFLAATAWHHQNKSKINPHGIELFTPPKEGEMEDIMTNVVAKMSPKELDKNVKIAKKLGYDRNILSHTTYDDIEVLSEIEADEDEYDYSLPLIEPVDFTGLTLYERTLVCLEKIRKK